MTFALHLCDYRFKYSLQLLNAHYLLNFQSKILFSFDFAAEL